jgi:translation initiation factor 2B subunit (eIF-2B alpha/beta/delta family)
MAAFAKILQDIRRLKIQGAWNVALAGLQAWSLAKNKELATKIILGTRPTEPLLRTVLHALNIGHEPKKLAEKLFHDKYKIFQNGARLVKSGDAIFTHCHSSAVLGILKEAKAQGKKIALHNTETRPLFQGRKTALELAKAGIKVEHYVDSAGLQALKGCSFVLVGADAVTHEGVYNKIGTGVFCELASQYLKIPVYVVAHSWKFSIADIEIEQRPAKEVWDIHQVNLKVHNPAFELVDKKFISKIICEKGTFSFGDFVRKFGHGW